MKVSFYHPNGEKYFYFLHTIIDVKFYSYPYFRRILGYHKGDNSTIKKNILNKLPTNCEVAIYGLVPFDPTIFLLVIQKILFNSKVILHTSYKDHEQGYFLKVFKPLFRFIVNKYVDAIVCTPENLKYEINNIYKCPIYGINHPFKKIQGISSTEKIYDYIFVGEKSEKKGFPRFIKLAKNYPESKFLAIGNLDNKSYSENLINLDHKDRYEVYKYIKCTKTLILPSKKIGGWEELFGIVIIEAISLGVNVISSNHLGPEYLKTKFPGKIHLIEDSDQAWLEVDFNKGVTFSDDNYDQEIREFGEEEISEKWKKVLNQILLR